MSIKKRIQETLKKPYRFAVFYTISIILITVFVLVDTFIIPHGIVKVSAEGNENASVVSMANVNESIEPTTIEEEQTTTEALEVNPIISSTGYTDDNIQIKIEEVSENGVVYYVADVLVSSAEYLKTALAEDTYGKNITAPTSEIASAHDAIFAINGDYYGFRDEGYVLRNGQLLRSTANGTDTEALVIDANGNLSIVCEAEVSAESLQSQGVQQILSFGPALIIDGEVVTRNTKNGLRDNPRTAIGQVEEGHYVFVVVDGRTSESDGVTLEELGNIMLKYGCQTAYNLDGGGTATMWFKGEVINNPTDGKNDGERNVSDIVYIGY